MLPDPAVPATALDLQPGETGPADSSLRTLSRQSRICYSVFRAGFDLFGRLPHGRGLDGDAASTVPVAPRLRLYRNWSANQRLRTPKIQVWIPHADRSKENISRTKGDPRANA